MIKKLIYLREHLSRVHRINRTLTQMVETTRSNENVSYVKLTNGKIFIGQPSQDHYKKLHFLLNKPIRKKVPPELMQTLIDIDFRYMSRRNNAMNLKEGKFLELEKGDVVLEIGAYIGFHAMRLSELVGPTGKVVAVEAIPANYAIMKKNIELNKLNNITPINMAIWKNKGFISMNMNDHQKNSIVDNVVQSKKMMKLPCNTIDDIVKDLNLKKVDYIRIQINGAELEALEGMKNVIKGKPKVLAAVPYKNKDEIERWFAEHGYRTQYTGHSIFAKYIA